MLTLLFNLLPSVFGLFKSKNDVAVANDNLAVAKQEGVNAHAETQNSLAQSGSKFTVFMLTDLQIVLVFLLLWNGVIVPNTGWHEIKTTFDATSLLFQLLGVTGVKHGVIFAHHVVKKLKSG